MGCTVVGTARTAEKLERCATSGSTTRCSPTVSWIPPRSPPTSPRPPGRRRDLELVGGGYLATDLAVAGLRGRIVLIGLMAGARSRSTSGRCMFKRLQVFGTMLRGRSVAEKAAATAAFTRDVIPLLESGVVSPVDRPHLPLDDAREAYDLLAADAVFGWPRARPDLRRARQPISTVTPVGSSARSTRNGRTESSPITQIDRVPVSGSSRTICR